MENYFYMHFGNDIPEHIEKEYNRLLFQEQYQDKKEHKYRVQTVVLDDVLEFCPDPASLPISDSELERKRKHDDRLGYLPIALGLLRIEFPNLYCLITDYYYTKEKVSMVEIGKKYGLTVDTVRYRISSAKKKLKSYIIMHENKE